MNSTDTLEPQERTPELTQPVSGFAGKAVRLERRIGWVLWGSLVVLLVAISS